jgi:hypothetical protein
MTQCERAPAWEPYLIAGTTGGGWAKREAEVARGTDEDAYGDISAACGAGRDAGAMCGAGVSASVACGVGGGTEATHGMDGDAGAVRGMKIVSGVPAIEEWYGGAIM